MSKLPKVKKRNKILEIMTLLPQSPDLSSIELVRDELDQRDQREYPKNETELFQCLKNTWEGLLSTYFFKNCWKFLPRICKAVIKAGDGFSDKNNK